MRGMDVLCGPKSQYWRVNKKMHDDNNNNLDQIMFVVHGHPSANTTPRNKEHDTQTLKVKRKDVVTPLALKCCTYTE